MDNKSIPNTTKQLSEITRKDWILYCWIEVESYFGDNDRTFVLGAKRTPSEALQAAEEWAFLESVENEHEEISSSDKDEVTN